MHNLLERVERAGIKATPEAIAKARTYAAMQEWAPSDTELSCAARDIGIKTILLAGIVYADLAERKMEAI